MKEEVVVAIVFVLLVIVIALWIIRGVLNRYGKDRIVIILNTILGVICSFGFGFVLLVIGMGELFIC